jgi:hypothetical protein
MGLVNYQILKQIINIKAIGKTIKEKVIALLNFKIVHLKEFTVKIKNLVEN